MGFSDILNVACQNYKGIGYQNENEKREKNLGWGKLLSNSVDLSLQEIFQILFVLILTYLILSQYSYDNSFHFHWKPQNELHQLNQTSNSF